MKLKVCGMKYKDNIEDISKLQPDYLGFIFYEKSPRNFEGNIPILENSIKKVGVFVNASKYFVINKVRQYNLDAVQLHGNESPEYCKDLNADLSSAELIKVFSIKDEFNFEILKSYEDCCDYFLFDTKGKLPGGNGYTFNWKVLEDYPSTRPFFLSGGIGLESIEDLKAFLKTESSKLCEVIDVNSRFEIEPGLKDVHKLESFIKSLTI